MVMGESVILLNQFSNVQVYLIFILLFLFNPTQFLLFPPSLSLVREVKEEANVDLLPQNLRQIGVFRQTFDDKPELLLQVHVFTSTIWKGWLNFFFLSFLPF